MPSFRPGQPPRPLPVRFALRLYKACASLRLAVVLIAVYATVLAWATFVESWYGTPAAHFGIYGTWWFILLNCLLGLNVLAAALIRFPWKRRQTGFLLTHLGILVLLAGSLVSHLRGVDSQLVLTEGGASGRAYQATQHFALEIQPTETAQVRPGKKTKTISVPFHAGPFNWEDYGQLWWFPWRLAPRSRGVIYDQGGIRLEVLDYLSDSRRMPVPQITLQVESDSASASGPSLSVGGVPMTLAVVAADHSAGGFGGPHAANRRFGLGQQQATPQGDRIVFWMTGSRAETDAFLQSRPEGSLGDLGQVVLYAGGKTHRFQVDQWQKQPRQPLGDTGLEVELVRLNTLMLGVQIDVHRAAEPPQPMTLFATLPHMNRQDDLHGVYGSYWLDPQSAALAGANRGQVGKELIRQAQRRRIDIIQGHDQRLYWRTWQAPHVGALGRWPAGGPDTGAVVGTKVVAFQSSGHPITVAVEKFIPRSEPGWEIQPLPFQKEGQRQSAAQRRARLRLSVDGHSEEFWLAATRGESLADEQHQVASRDRLVSISLAPDFIDLGFQVFLHRFERKLEPGTDRPAYFASLVDFLDAEDQGQRLEEHVLITMNQPVDFTDPKTRRSYRLFQASYYEPQRPGDPGYQPPQGNEKPRPLVYGSVLSVNHDPGRGLKYAGSLLICLGILIVYYVRAYFSRQRVTEEGGRRNAEC
jgi:hypothetical protein